MSVYPTTQHLARGLAVAGAIIASLTFTGLASAAEWSATTVDGNPSCSSLDSAYSEVKLEPVREGRQTFGDGVLTGSIDARGAFFDWTAASAVNAVIVKGGPGANIYRGAGTATSGTGLHAPINFSSGQPYGLSHISFCYTPGQTGPAPQPGPCEPGGPTTMPDGKPCNTTPGPCEPGGPTTMPDGKPCTTTPGPCEPGGPTTMPDGKPCTTTPGPCEPGGPTTMPDGKPCTTTPTDPKKPGPCEPGGPTTMPDGKPCTTTPTDQTPNNETPTQTSTEQPAQTAPSTSDEGAPAQGGVLGDSAQGVPARARMSGPRRCVSGTYTQVVRGKGIKRVTFSVNGRKVRTLTGSRSSYRLRIDPRTHATGVMRVRARVEFVAASAKRPRTLRTTVLSCAARSGLPVRFAG